MFIGNGKNEPVRVIEKIDDETWDFSRPTIWKGRVEDFLAAAPRRPLFDLVVTSPPYNIRKKYERKQKALSEYFSEQRKIIKEIVTRLKTNGSICWQVGNYIDDGEIIPLDLEFHKIFRKFNLQLRNRIVWTFGHGLHSKRRFSGRYEVILWYTNGNDYVFDIDAVRVPSKYPAKKHYKGKNKGQYSSNPLGKNPEDVWSIPNVKGNHIEKTEHPCQFPIGLIERLVLALTKKGDLVFDPFAGVCSSGAAAISHGRHFVGCEQVGRYVRIGQTRLQEAVRGEMRYRPHDKAIYDHTNSKLSIKPFDSEVEQI